MPIEVKRTGTVPRFNAAKAAQIIRAYVPGAILRRTDRGVSSTGAPFAPYSKSYREKLIAGSEDTKVDLRLTGGLMNSIKGVVTTTATQVAVTFAPDTGTSPQVSLGNGKAKRTGRRSPPHNVLGWYLHHGNGKMPPRPFMGLTTAEETSLAKLLRSANLWG